MANNLEGTERARVELEAGRPSLVWRKVVADTVTPVGAALNVMEDGRGDFLLESVEGGEVRGRYSLLGLDPDLVFRAEGDSAAINREWKRDRDRFETCAAPTLEALRALLAECRFDVPQDLPPALACLVGYFGYETIGLVEKLPQPKSAPLEVPDMLFVRPTLILVFDNLSDQLFCIAPLWPDADDLDGLISRAAERIDTALARLGSAVVPRCVDASALPEIQPHSTMAAEDYEAMVVRAKEYIAAGDIFQVVLSQRFTARYGA